MTDLQAAMGLVQLKRLPVMQARRRAIVECYTDGLRGLEQVELPAQRSDSESAWHLYPIRVGSGETSEQRDRFIERLTELQIGTSVHFIPLHVHPFYRDKYGYRPGAFPVAHRAFHQLLSLPLHPGLTGTDVDDVIQAVRTAALS